MEKAENFIELQTAIYKIYQKLYESDIKKDIKKYNNLMEKLKYLIGKQDAYFYNININSEYELVQQGVRKLYEGHSPDRSEKEIDRGIFLTAMTKRIDNLRNYHTRGYRDQCIYSFENELNKRAIRVLNLVIAMTIDEEEKENLIQMFYNILYTSPTLETEYLIDPEAFVKETDESKVNNRNKIREYIDLENHAIKCTIIDMMYNILYLNETLDYYVTYSTIFNAIYIKAYLSFLSQSDIREIKENLKIIIETYPGKLPQEIINYVLDIVNSALKNIGKGKILPFKQKIENE